MLIPVQLAALRGSEEAHLVLVNEALAAVLVRVLPEPDERPDEGWFLQVGFGPCNREGLIFPTLEAAEVWTRAQFHACKLCRRTQSTARPNRIQRRSCPYQLKL